MLLNRRESAVVLLQTRVRGKMSKRAARERALLHVDQIGMELGARPSYYLPGRSTWTPASIEEDGAIRVIQSFMRKMLQRLENKKNGASDQDAADDGSGVGGGSGDVAGSVAVGPAE